MEGAQAHRQGRELTRQAADSAVRSGSKEPRPFGWSQGALREAEVGNFVEAIKMANAALTLPQTKIHKFWQL
jgi:hypothetical protein